MRLFGLIEIKNGATEKEMWDIPRLKYLNTFIIFCTQIQEALLFNSLFLYLFQHEQQQTE